MRTYKLGAFVLAALITVGAGCASTTSTDVEVDAGAGAAAGTQLENTPPANDTPDVQINLDADVSAGAVKEFTVVGDNFAFDLKEMKVKKGDKVRVTFNNVEGFHDWVLDEFGAKTAQLQAGGQETVEFTADKTGTFEYYCSVGKHRAMGMTGKLIVE